MHEIETDTGKLPKPAKCGRPATWPFDRMTEKGMFFFVPATMYTKKVLQSIASRANKKHKVKRKFSVIQHDQDGKEYEKNGEKGYRVYRLI